MSKFASRLRAIEEAFLIANSANDIGVQLDGEIQSRELLHKYLPVALTSGQASKDLIMKHLQEVSGLPSNTPFLDQYVDWYLRDPANFPHNPHNEILFAVLSAGHAVNEGWDGVKSKIRMGYPNDSD